MKLNAQDTKIDGLRAQRENLDKILSEAETNLKKVSGLSFPFNIKIDRFKRCIFILF